MPHKLLQSIKGLRTHMENIMFNRNTYIQKAHSAFQKIVDCEPLEKCQGSVRIYP